VPQGVGVQVPPPAPKYFLEKIRLPEINTMENTAQDITARVSGTNDDTREIQITVAANTFSSKYNSSLSKIQQRATLKGFRPGKAPRKVVEQLYGDDARAEILQGFLDTGLRQAAMESKIRIFSVDNFNVESAVIGSDVQLKVAVSIIPQPEIKTYEGLKVSYVETAFEQKLVDDEIDSLQKKFSSSKELQGRDTAEKGDLVYLSYVATPTEEGSEEKNSEPVEKSGALIIGKNTFPESIEKACIGKKADAEFTETVTFAEDFYISELSGKTCSVKATLSSIRSYETPALDDDFAKLTGKGETWSEVKKEIEERVQAEVEDANKQAKRLALLDAIVEQNPFNIPPSLADELSYESLVNLGLVKRMEDARKIDITQFPQLRDSSTQRAKREITVAMLVEKLKIEAEEADMEAQIEKFITQKLAPTEELRKYYAKEENRNQLKGAVTEEKLLEQLEQKNVFEVKKAEEKTEK
jgi:trigger factor